MRLRLGTAIALTAHAITSGSVQAQTEEITVTARKRVELLAYVPIQATTLSAQQIEAYDLTSIEKIGAVVPQLFIGRAPNGSGARLTLRGIGASPTSIGIEQSVAVIVDGVYFGQGRIINEALFDLQSVEVLRGPQALFFGKNATAGVISVSTANPTGERSANVRGAYEIGAAQTTAEATLSLPLSDALAMRVAVRGSYMAQGYFENRAQALPDRRIDIATGSVSTLTQPAPSATDVPAERDAVGRLTLTYRPSEQLRIIVKASGSSDDSRGGGYNNVIFSCPTGYSSLNPAVPCRRDFVSYANDMPAQIATTLPYARSGALYNRYRSSSVTAAADLHTHAVDLSLVANYQRNGNAWAIAGDEQSSITPTFATENSTWEGASAELRALASWASSWTGLAGLYAQTTRRDFSQWVSIAGLENSAAEPRYRYVGFAKDSATDGNTISPYLQLTWQPRDAVEVAAGARYTVEKKDSLFLQPYVHPALTGLFRSRSVAAAAQSFRNVSPEASITWRATSQYTLYGAYKTAYKSGGFSNSGIYGTRGSVEDFVFGPERAKGFEAGLKAQVLDGQLRANIGIFDYRYTGLQVDFFNSIIFAFVTTNAGSARTRGIETDLTWAPRAIAGFSVRGSLNYDHARYEDFLAPCYNGQTPAAGCTLVAEGGVPGQQLAGARLALAPSWTATLGMDYERPVSEAFGLGLSIQGRFTSDYLASGFSNPLTRQPAFATLDARAAIRARGGEWQLAIVGKNLSNAFYLTSAGDGPGTGRGTGTAGGITSDQIGLVAPPRTVALELSWRF